MSTTTLVLLLLHLGQSASVPGTTATIILESVQDHRCPSDVVCVWAGYAAVTLGLRDGPGQPSRRIIVSQPGLEAHNLPSRVVIQGRALTLERLEPRRTARPTGPPPTTVASIGVSPAE